MHALRPGYLLTLSKCHSLSPDSDRHHLLHITTQSTDIKFTFVIDPCMRQASLSHTLSQLAELSLSHRGHKAAVDKTMALTSHGFLVDHSLQLRLVINKLLPPINIPSSSSYRHLVCTEHVHYVQSQTFIQELCTQTFATLARVKPMWRNSNIRS